MVLSLSTLASPTTLLRLNFLRKPPSLFSTLTTLRTNQLPLLKRSFAATLKRDADVVVLGIETSCDDTAAAVVSSNRRFPFVDYSFCVVRRLMICVCGVLGEKQRSNSEPSRVFSGTLN